MQKKYFITGISTEVGKTIVAAIFTEALQADYWKPIQAGDLQFGDKDKVKSLLSNTKSKIFSNTYALETPMSPHAAAEIDNIVITRSKIKEPKTTNHLVIEGAGGLLVPLNDTLTIADLIQEDYHVIVVSKHYLGSINHTLLSHYYLQQRKIKHSILFVGEENLTTEKIIEKKTDVPILGRIPLLPTINATTILQQAQQIKNRIL